MSRTRYDVAWYWNGSEWLEVGLDEVEALRAEGHEVREGKRSIGAPEGPPDLYSRRGRR